MTAPSRWRMSVALAALAVVVVWPPVHHVLARRCDLDPWSFFGWAMYSVPNLRVNVRAAALDTEGNEDWNAISPRLWRPMREYAERRERFGCLLVPDGLAEIIFAAQPELSRLRIRVQRWVIDRESARIAPRNRDYDFSAPWQASPRRLRGVRGSR